MYNSTCSQWVERGDDLCAGQSFQTVLQSLQLNTLLTVVWCVHQHRQTTLHGGQFTADHSHVLQTNTWTFQIHIRTHVKCVKTCVIHHLRLKSLLDVGTESAPLSASCSASAANCIRDFTWSISTNTCHTSI